MRQHTSLVINVIATATAVMALAACGSSGNGSGGANNSGGPVGGASTTITAVGTGTTSGGGGGGGGNPYSTGPVSQSGKLGARSAAQPFFFTPTPDTIAAGSTVTYAFQNVGHTVTFDTPGAPGTPADISSLAAGGVANADSTRVFAMAGTYTYHCSIHTYMHGTVVVQ